MLGRPLERIAQLLELLERGWHEKPRLSFCEYLALDVFGPELTLDSQFADPRRENFYDVEDTTVIERLQKIENGNFVDEKFTEQKKLLKGLLDCWHREPNQNQRFGQLLYNILGTVIIWKDFAKTSNAVVSHAIAFENGRYALPL